MDERKDGDILRSTKVTSDKIVDVTTQDIEPYADFARTLRDSTSEHGKYSRETFGCVHAATIPIVELEKMQRGQCCNDGHTYDLDSNDPDEARRALVHIQNCHKEWLTVRGRPFARKRPVWQ